MPPPQSSFSTFRDPAGSLRMENDRVLRIVRPGFAAATEEFLSSSLARELIASGALIETSALGFLPDGSLELEHRRVEFPSYPWEWSASQWSDAALLTLDICDKLLDHGLILKDATPLNILFCGVRPVLVDLLSIEPRDPGSPLWIAYGQFVRTFLLPLIAHRELGWPLASARFRRDGFEPEDLYPHLPFHRRWMGPARSHIALPILFDRFAKRGQPPVSMRFAPETSAAILHDRLRSLRKTVLGLAPRRSASHWSGYTTHCDHYSIGARARKEAFVAEALAIARPATVLDLGANTGVFSRLAANAGARVVALDIDEVSTDRHYRSAQRANLPILPLRANIARPTPSAGWRYQESLSLLDRCRHRFDCIFFLGLLHHLLVSEQIPLTELARLAAELAPRSIVAEWIPPTDPKFIEICRGRDALYAGLTEDSFLDAFACAFRSVLREPLENGRVLHLLEAR